MKLPKCPNCQNKMVPIIYSNPDEFFLEEEQKQNLFYGGCKYKEEFDDNEINEKLNMVYHCFNCNLSYDKKLENHIIEKDRHYFLDELSLIVNDISDDVIKKLNQEEKKSILEHDNYIDHHFGFGLYIRNNFIYNNDKIKYKIEADFLSHRIFDEIVKKLRKDYHK